MVCTAKRAPQTVVVGSQTQDNRLRAAGLQLRSLSGVRQWVPVPAGTLPARSPAGQWEGNKLRSIAWLPQAGRVCLPCLLAACAPTLGSSRSGQDAVPCVLSVAGQFNLTALPPQLPVMLLLLLLLPGGEGGRNARLDVLPVLPVLLLGLTQQSAGRRCSHMGCGKRMLRW